MAAAPLLAPALAFLVGVAVAPLLPVAPDVLLLLLALPIGASALSRRRPLILAAGACWLLAAGVLRAQASAQGPADDIARFNGQFVELHGTVADEPDVRDRSVLLRFRVDAVAGGTRSRPIWQAAEGTIQLRVPLTPAYAYGDALDVRGRLQAPPTLPDFNYRDYLARQGVGSVMSYARITKEGTGATDPLHRLVIAMRERIAGALAQALPEPEASLQRAILIGTRSATFSNLTPDFIRTGMIHIVATSGFKVAIVGGALMGLFAPIVGRRRAVLPTLALAALYILVTGATPAGVRAGLMWAVTLGALLAGRPAASLQGLALAVVAMVAVQPAVLGDTGFQLSAGATAGIIVLQPRMAGWFARWPHWLAEPVGVTLAAQVGTLPITMVGFHQVSLMAPFANLICLPVLPAAMAAGTAVVLAQTLSPILGHLLGLLASGFLGFMIGVVHLLAQVPFAAISAPALGGLFSLLYYAACLALVPVLRRSAPAVPVQHLPVVARLALAGVVVIAVPLFTTAAARPQARADLTFLNVGRGDALLIRDAAGQTVLVDSGPSGQALLAELGSSLPFWVKRVDVLVLLGAEGAHAGAAQELNQRYTLGRVLMPPGPTKPSATTSASRTALTTVALVVGGPDSASLQTAGGIRIDVQPAGGTTAPHLLVRVQVGAVSILDAAALSTADQHRLVTSGDLSEAAALIVPAGAADTAIAPGFLQSVSPALILAGAPPPKASPYDFGQVPLLRTDQAGTIHLVTDGHTLGLE